MLLIPGLCSVTFRALDPDVVVGLAANAGLSAIEWGADVHLLPGSTRKAAEIRNRCGDAGISCPSYGSYWFGGQSALDELPPLFDSAEALGSARIRIWARFGVESGAPEDDRSAVADGIRAAVDLAAPRGLELALEFHPGTLTHEADSALALLSDVDRSSLTSYWQPDPRWNTQRSLGEFRRLSGRISNLHVFAWRGAPPERLPLEEQGELWRPVLAECAATARERSAAYLEFVRDDDPAALQHDAATLCGWLEEIAT